MKIQEDIPLLNSIGRVEVSDKTGAEYWDKSSLPKKVPLLCNGTSFIQTFFTNTAKVIARN